MKTIVMIPTYNESENIAKLIQAIKQLPIKNLHVLVTDDNSPDETWKIVEKLSKKDKTIHLLRRMENKGRGLAGIAGFKEALQLGADAIIEMDADYSHHPKYIPKLLEALHDGDMALGSRFVKGGSDGDRPLWRQFVTFGANMYIKLFLGVKVKDCNSGYRCYKRKVLETINLDTMIAKGPDIVQEILYKVHLKKFKIVEVPISFEERKEGKSKLGMKHLFKGYTMVLKLKFLHLVGKL